VGIDGIDTDAAGGHGVGKLLEGVAVVDATGDTGGQGEVRVDGPG